MFRPVLLTAVILAVCWGFWTNSQNRIAALGAQSLFSDETGSLTQRQKDFVLGQIRAVREESGLMLEVNILRRPPALTRHDGARIYLDLVPGQKRAYLSLPPLVRRAVGEGFARDMERSLEQDFASDTWQEGLQQTLASIRKKLAEVTR